MVSLSPEIAARLCAAAPGTDDAGAIAPHLGEWRGRWHGQTRLMLRPTTTDEVARVLAICNETKTPIVPQGGNTGLVGGQIPAHGEVLLSLERMNGIRAVSPDDNAMIAEAGVVLADAQAAADAHGRLFPLSLAAEGSCTIGGNVSTNAGGVHVLRYGMMRDLVLGLEVVLADGRVLNLMRGLRKDNTGYDLKQLFIGAEGTLGVVTAAMVKLFPKPAGAVTAYIGLTALEAAVPLLNRMQDATGTLVSAFELMPRFGVDLVLRHIPGAGDPLPAHKGWSVLMEISHPSAFDATTAAEEALALAMEDGLIADAVFAKSARDREALWRLRETMPEAQKLDGASISNDVSVTPSKIAAFVPAAETALAKCFPAARPFAFGHVGDGNLHLAVRAAPGADESLLAARADIEAAVNDCVARFGGSISAEHGLGLAKKDIIACYKSADELAVMRTLKTALDPNAILNPGKMWPEDA